MSHRQYELRRSLDVLDRFSDENPEAMSQARAALLPLVEAVIAESEHVIAAARRALAGPDPEWAVELLAEHEEDAQGRIRVLRSAIEAALRSAPSGRDMLTTDQGQRLRALK